MEDSIEVKSHRISRVIQAGRNSRVIQAGRNSRVIQVEASLENSEINQCNIHHIFVLALLDRLVFYTLSFGSLHTTRSVTCR